MDILSTYGTQPPLQAIGTGNDVTVFAGYMLQGGTPILAKAGTEFNGVEDLVGKRVVGDPSDHAMGLALLDKGYDPNTDVEWVPYGEETANMEMVRKGEADFCVGTTGIQWMAKDMGLEAVGFSSTLWPEYSCCRVYTSTEWLNNNAEGAKLLLKAWLRAQEVLESDPDFAVEQVVAQTDLDTDYVDNYINNSPLMIRLDPHWEAVSNAWNYFAQMGIVGEHDDIETLKSHFNIEIYKQALDECCEEYYDENPEFYDYYKNYFEEVNAELLK